MVSRDTLDPDNPDHQEFAQKRKEAVQKRMDALLADYLKTPYGRELFWYLLGDTGVFHSSFSSDPLVMAKREGRREIGLGLLERIENLGPEYLPNMQLEANNRAVLERLEREKFLERNAGT